MIAYNALILTPRGSRYLYHLRPGASVWTYKDGVFITVPLEYEPADRMSEVSCSVEQRSYMTFQDRIIPSGRVGHTFPMIDCAIITIDQSMTLFKSIGKAVPRVPWQSLQVKRRPPNEWLDGPSAWAKLQHNSKRPLNGFKPHPEVKLDPTEGLVEFGGDRYLIRVKLTGRSVPAVKTSTNVISNGLILVGD